MPKNSRVKSDNDLISVSLKGSTGGGAAHFVILSGEKSRMLENGLSETGELSRRI